MAKPNFAEILKGAKLGEIEKPKPLPIGSYQAMIKTIEYGETMGDKKTPYVRFNVETVQHMDDVNEVDIENAGGAEKLRGKKLRVDFFLTPDAMYRLQDFVIEHVGLDSLKGVDLDQAIPQLVNNLVGIKVKHRPDKNDPEMLYAEVERTFNPN